MPKIGTKARVTGGTGEKRRVRFAPSPRIIPDACTGNYARQLCEFDNLGTKIIIFTSKLSEEALILLEKKPLKCNDLVVVDSLISFDPRISTASVLNPKFQIVPSIE